MNDLLLRYQRLASAALDQATALPFEIYHTEEIFKLEAERIFHKEWVFACAEQAIVKPGDYFAFDLVGEAIVILRDQKGDLRAMSNICRHRGTLLLDEGFGNAGKRIVCPYHAWTYNDHGKLVGVPFPGSVQLEKEKHCLPHFKVESWAGLLFVNLDPSAAPLSKRLEGIDTYTSVFDLQRFNAYANGTQEDWDANWKLAMENAVESYHVFKVHKETLETVGPSKLAYNVAGSAEWTITGGKSVDQSSALMKWFRGKYPEALGHYQVISLPPSFVGILNYDSFSWVQILPNGAGKSVVRSGALFPKTMVGEDNASKVFTNAFFAEDKWICERVQKGMRSTLCQGGKLVELEKSVVDFHQYLASRLFNVPISAFYEEDTAKLFKS